MPRGKDMPRCIVTDLPEEWCAHCRGKSNTEEEEAKLAWDQMFKKWSQFTG